MSLNAGAHHWIRTSRHPGGSVCVMDSRALFSLIARLQLAKIPLPALPPWSSLHVEIIPIEQQDGLHDCGLFAVAKGCLGRSPESTSKHLIIKYLNEKHWTRGYVSTSKTLLYPISTPVCVSPEIRSLTTCVYVFTMWLSATPYILHVPSTHGTHAHVW